MALYPIPPEADSQLGHESKLANRVARPLLQRYPVWPIVDHLAQKAVPLHRQTVWYNMGGIALFFLAVQIVTGVLLMVYYRPAQPWLSVQRIVMEIPFGNVVRSIHHWSANLMILALFVHLFSTFFMKAYRPPREITWLTGVLLIGITFFFGFSGYLLPWDDLSFFATRVGMSELEKAPLVGGWLANLARGGSDVTVDTIGRFYVLHVTVLPALILMLVAFHLLLVQIQGVSEPDSFTVLPEKKKRYQKFFKEFLFAELPIWLFLSALLVALAAILPKGLMPEAETFAPAPEGIKPEWYFLSQFQLLKLFPGKIEIIGLILMALLLVGLFLLPFIDRSIPVDRRGRRVRGLGVLALLGLIFFTIWGWWS